MIFCTSKYSYLRDEICSLTGIAPGQLEAKTFPDGERYRRITQSVVGKEVIIVGGSVDDSETLEIYDLACALVKYGAHTITLMIPYFGYSTMEREVLQGEVLPAKTRARLFSVIPMAPGGNRVVLLDIHAPGLPHYFEGNVRVRALDSHDLLVESMKYFGDEDFVIACTDSGRAKTVERLAESLGVSAVFVFKKRIDGQNTEVKAVAGEVKNKNVVLYDDMIRSGSSLIEAAKQLKDFGALKITALATHGLFPGNATEKLKNAGVFHKIYVTNSHCRVNELTEADGIEVISVAPMLSKALRELQTIT